MRKEESEEDSKIISAAGKDVYWNCDNKDWSPYRRSKPQVVCWAVEQAQGITDNGGFQYFFENDWPDNPAYSLFVDAFRQIGANESADCLEDAVGQFPFENPHLDFEKRREYLVSSRSEKGKYDSLIDILGDRVIDLGGGNYTKLAAYVRANMEHFPRAREFLEQK